MQIDPKTSMYTMLATAVLGVLAGAGAQLTTLFGSTDATMIVTACGLSVAVLGAVGAVLHGYSSNQPGPLTK